MAKFTLKLLQASVCAVAIFWLYKGGVWLGALTTVRTPLYFQIHAVGAWVIAIITGIAIFMQDDV